jgi:hypothetical protein
VSEFLNSLNDMIIVDNYEINLRKKLTDDDFTFIKNLNYEKKKNLFKKIVLMDLDIEFDDNFLNNVYSIIKLDQNVYTDVFIEFIEYFEIKKAYDINEFVTYFVQKIINENIEKKFIEKLFEKFDLMFIECNDIIYFDTIIRKMFKYDKKTLLKKIINIKNYKDCVLKRKKLFLSLFTIDELNLKEFEKLI